MSPRAIHYRRLRCLAAVTALILLTPLVTAAPASDVRAEDGDAHRIRITRQRPPCSRPAGLPVVPNGPGALVTGSGTRCYGTRPPELELWLPEERYLWLDRSAPNPAAWIDLGAVVVDARVLSEAPLGLRLARDGDTWSLETRHGQTATLTRLEPGEWQEVTSPDGQRFWVVLDAPAERRTLGAGTVRYRAD